MKNKFPKGLRVALQALFSVGVLVWLAQALGARDLLKLFKQIDLLTLTYGVGLYVVAQLLSAWRWQVIAQMLRFEGNFLKFNALYFLGMFYNIFLPTGYGGDVIKTVFLAPHRTPPSNRLAALSVLIDRFTGLVALLLLGGIASVGLTAHLGCWGIVMGVGFVLAMVMGVVALWVASKWKRVPRKLRALALLMRSQGLRFIPVAVLSVVIQLLNIAIYTMVLHQLGAAISVVNVTFCYALVTIATLLPVSIGGLGVRESGWAALLIPLGVAGGIGVSAGLVYFLIQTLSSLFGLYPFFTIKLNKTQSSQLGAVK